MVAPCGNRPVQRSVAFSLHAPGTPCLQLPACLLGRPAWPEPPICNLLQDDDRWQRTWRRYCFQNTARVLGCTGSASVTKSFVPRSHANSTLLIPAGMSPDVQSSSRTRSTAARASAGPVCLHAATAPITSTTTVELMKIYQQTWNGQHAAAPRTALPPTCEVRDDLYLKL